MKKHRYIMYIVMIRHRSVAMDISMPMFGKC